MSEENKQESPSFDLRQVFLKDASFESPSSPYIFAELKDRPEVELDVRVKYKPINEEKTIYECVLFISARGIANEKTAFIAEVQQAGIFLLRNFPENDITPMMEIVAATQIFPYSREAISHLVTRGGFPPVIIKPINFEELFRSNAIKKQRAAQENLKNDNAQEEVKDENVTTH